MNKERYSDPTAEKAIAHVMRERKKQEGDNLVKKQSERKRQRKPENYIKSGMKLVEISRQLDCSAATIRTWKNRYKWDGESETFQNQNETKRNVSEKK